MPPQLPPESHYDPNKLAKIFAIAAIILLVSLIGIFAKDYSRQWKDYQRQFRELEVEKTRIKLDAEETGLSQNEDYQSVLKNLAELQEKSKTQTSSIAELKKSLGAAEDKEKLHTQKYQFVKAQLDALKYKYETTAWAGGKDAQKLEARLHKLDDEVGKLRLLVEDAQKEVKTKTDAIAHVQKEFKEVDKKRLTAVKKKEILDRKLKRIDLAQMSVANQVADRVRNLPLIDLANPDYKIRQIVIKDIPEDVNFMKVQRVDRCTTCHLGIDNEDFKDVGQPLQSHSNLQLFVDKNSPHPVEQFACTACHQGRGRGTDFISAAHTPRNAEQEHEWKKKYGWHELERWEHPMFPVGMTQAGCFKCHQAQEVVKGAEKLNLGMALIERAGCYGCHTIEKYKDWPKAGPGLEFLAAKTTKEWAYHWIANPKAIRFNTWMPSYFNQSNNSDPQSIKRGEQEINSMVHFLFANSKPFDVKAEAITGNGEKGKELVESVGCMACHQVETDKTKTKPRNMATLHREFGPNLIGLGSKTSQAWLYDWLKNPTRYHGDTRMPNFRLTDQEAADMAAYLAQGESPVTKQPVPPVDEQILNTVVLDFLKKNDPLAAAEAKLKAMDVNAKLNFAGQRLIREYGCFSCHNIPGFEHDKPIGVELTEEGSKSLERLDFAFSKIEHSKRSWFEQKLLDPRIFDHGRVLKPLERLKMPNFYFTPEEAEAITTVILGMVKDKPDITKMPNQGIKKTFINEGQKTVRQLNCQACHLIEGDGGVIQGSVLDWLVTHQGKDPNDAKSLVTSFSPPNLIGEGEKVQAQWLYEFLHDPTPIRPWLSVRMPTYSYHGDQLNSIVKYFNYLDDAQFPFTDLYHPKLSKEEFAAAEKLFSKEIFGCAQCHIVGDKMPGGTPDSWAPDFGLAAKRLKPEWLIKWLENPAALLPGTKMPTYFDPVNFDESGPPDILEGDEHRQIKALRDYLLTISEHPELMKQEEQAPAAKSTPQAEAPAK